MGILTQQNIDDILRNNLKDPFNILGMHWEKDGISVRVFAPEAKSMAIAKSGVHELVCSMIRVRDEGCGFDPESLPDPLAPENILKSSGRGIFLIRSFMDDVQLQRAPEGGMEIRMVKRVQPGEPSGDANGSAHA